MLTTLSGSSQSPRPNGEPGKRRLLCCIVQNPQRGYQHHTSAKNSGDISGRRQIPSSCGLAQVQRTQQQRVVSHYNVSP